MITYNHEKFISDAINGVLQQKTDFPVQLIIGEDCSTDNTRLICQDYVTRHPEKIVLTSNEVNLGMSKNFNQTLNLCTSRYIALCDGDDYWTDPLKLVRQIEYLEKNSGCVATFHNVNANENNRLIGLGYLANPGDFDIGNLFRGCNMISCTLVFRNTGPFPDDLVINDTTLGLFLLENGHAHYVDRIMAEYRIHVGGVFSKTSVLDRYKLYLKFKEVIEKKYITRYPEEIRHSAVHFCKTFALQYLGERSFNKAFDCYMELVVLQKNPFRTLRFTVTFLKQFSVGVWGRLLGN